MLPDGPDGPSDAEYIANRLLNGPSALAALWASVRLPADALRSCLSLRSTKPRPEAADWLTAHLSRDR